MGVSAIGAFSCAGPNSRIWASSDAFPSTWPDYGDRNVGVEFETPPEIQKNLHRQDVIRLDPTWFGLENGFVVCVPFRHNSNESAGYVLFFDIRRRSLGPRTAQSMRDIAELFASLIPKAVEPHADSASDHEFAPYAVHTNGLGRIKTHHEVHRMIFAARSEAHQDHPMSLLLLDIDRFHAINRALGATVADALIDVIASRLQTQLCDGDVVARTEADRFLILSCRDAEDLTNFAVQLLEQVNETVRIMEQSVSVQATIGLVIPGNGDISEPVLFLQAESALRRGKLDGGNRIVMHEPRIDALGQAQSRLEIDLGEAAASGQLRLMYQPYVELRTNRVSGAEALLRWDHPERGNLEPASFISLAESTGQILGIGAWVLNQAMREALDWSGDQKLSVNISALQFHQPDFVAQVELALAQSGFPAERLELEITETVLLRDGPETTDQIRTLIGQGVQIALDDFGTGYNALATLARIPHHRIKLDRSFIVDLAKPHTRDLVQAIVDSARTQGLEITAEGIETFEQLETVREMGFTHAQGYAISQPVDGANILIADPPQTVIA